MIQRPQQRDPERWATTRPPVRLQRLERVRLRARALNAYIPFGVERLRTILVKQPGTDVLSVPIDLQELFMYLVQSTKLCTFKSAPVSREVIRVSR